MMKRLILCTLLLATRGGALLLAACGGEEAPPPTSSPAPSAPEPVAAEPAAPARAPLTGTPEERCATLLDRAWSEASAILGELGTDASAAEGEYRSLASGFGRRCAALEAAQIECIGAAERTLDGIATCQVNAGRPLAEQVRPPQVIWLASSLVDGDTFRGAALTGADADAARAALVGSWARGEEVMTFEADGHVTIEGRQAGDFDATLVDLHGLHLAPRGEGRPRDVTFARIGEQLYVAAMPGWQPQPVSDAGRAIAIDTDAFFVVEGLGGAAPTCHGWHEEGMSLASVSCAISGEGDQRTLAIDYTFGAHPDGTTHDRAATLRLAMRDGVLLSTTPNLYFDRRP